jgi:anti-sigma regulatory factor (Ser/Thr protein kinase)
MPLMRALMDDVTVDATPSGTTVTLRRQLSSRS